MDLKGSDTTTRCTAVPPRLAGRFASTAARTTWVPYRRSVLSDPRHIAKSRTDTHRLVQSDQEGALWRDPPEYFEQIVYPAYERAHTRVFEGGDIERGAPSGFVERLVLIDGDKEKMEGVFEKACEAVRVETEAYIEMKGVE